MERGRATGAGRAGEFTRNSSARRAGAAQVYANAGDAGDPGGFKKDHRRMMDLLGIKELRRGADGDAKSPNAANYDESKADVYPNMPDPLVLKTASA